MAETNTTWYTKIQHRYAQTWDETYTPLEGEITVYAPDENYSIPRIIIGDGVKSLGQLPFTSNIALNKEHALIVPTCRTAGGYGDAIFGSNNYTDGGAYTNVFYITGIKANDQQTEINVFISKTPTDAQKSSANLNFTNPVYDSTKIVDLAVDVSKVAPKLTLGCDWANWDRTTAEAVKSIDGNKVTYSLSANKDTNGTGDYLYRMLFVEDQGWRSENNSYDLGVFNTLCFSIDAIEGCGDTVMLGYNFVGGYNNFIDGYVNTVGGLTNFVKGNYNVVLGSEMTVESSNACAFGSDHKVYGKYSVAGGWGNIINSTARFAAAFGQSNNLEAYHTFVAGNQNTVSGKYGASFGFNNKLSAQYGFTAGYDNDITGESSAGFGQDIHIYARRSFGAGSYITIKAENGIALGATNTITESGKNSIVLGTNNTAENQEALVLGSRCSVKGLRGVAIGNNSKANQEQAIAIGGNAIAAIAKSMAIGWNCQSAEDGAVTIGTGLTSQKKYQTVIGAYNDNSDTDFGKALFVVANGTKDSSTGEVSPSNLFAVGVDVNTKESYIKLSKTKVTENTLKDIATKAYTQTQLKAYASKTDLDSYATTIYVDEAIQNVTSPDLTGYATEQYVTEQIDNLGIPDVDNYYTKEDADRKFLTTDSVEFQEKLSYNYAEETYATKLESASLSYASHNGVDVYGGSGIDLNIKDWAPDQYGLVVLGITNNITPLISIVVLYPDNLNGGSNPLTPQLYYSDSLGYCIKLAGWDAKDAMSSQIKVRTVFANPKFA